MNEKHKRTIKRKIWCQLWHKEKNMKTIYKDGKVYTSKLYQYMYGSV